MTQYHIQADNTTVRHTSSDVYRPVIAFLEIGFATATVIAQTAVTSVVCFFAVTLMKSSYSVLSV